MTLKHGDRVALKYDSKKYGTLFCIDDEKYYIKIDPSAPNQGWLVNHRYTYLSQDQVHTWWAVELQDLVKISPLTYREIFTRNLLS